MYVCMLFWYVLQQIGPQNNPNQSPTHSLEKIRYSHRFFEFFPWFPFVVPFSRNLANPNFCGFFFQPRPAMLVAMVTASEMGPLEDWRMKFMAIQWLIRSRRFKYFKYFHQVNLMFSGNHCTKTVSSATLPETNSKSTWKLMVGRLYSFLLGPSFLAGATCCSFWEDNHNSNANNLDLPPTQDASGKWRFRLGSLYKNVMSSWWYLFLGGGWTH